MNRFPTVTSLGTDKVAQRAGAAADTTADEARKVTTVGSADRMDAVAAGKDTVDQTETADIAAATTQPTRPTTTTPLRLSDRRRPFGKDPR